MQPTELIACNTSGVFIWDISNGANAQLKEKITVPKTIHGCSSVTRDAHNSNVLAYANDKSFTLVDTR